MPYADINGTQLYYDVQGQGIPIVFIHPPLITSACFVCQQAGLSAHYKTIIFDIRGHGDSAPSPVPLTYELIADDIRQLLDRLNIEQAYLCGYSTGGSVALEAMLSYPERIKGAIIISGMSETTDLITKGLIWLSSRLCYAPVSKLLAYSFAVGNAHATDIQNKLYDSAVKSCLPNVRQYFAYSKSYNCTDRLEDISAPVLLIYGGKDFLFQRYGKLLLHRLSSCSLAVIPDAFHQLPVKFAALMNEQISGWMALQSGDRTDQPALPAHLPAAEDEPATGYFERY